MRPVFAFDGLSGHWHSHSDSPGGCRIENLAVHLALHGALVLAVILVAGLLLDRAILRDGNVPGRHLLHSGGSGRAVPDALAIPAAAIMGIGRLGNFIDGQIVGSVTTVWWALTFPDAEGFRHPVVRDDGLLQPGC